MEAARSHVDEMEEGREFSFDLNLPMKYSQYRVALNKSRGVKPKFPIESIVLLSFDPMQRKSKLTFNSFGIRWLFLEAS